MACRGICDEEWNFSYGWRKRAADGVREDLETRPPVKVQEVEEMQKEVIRIARNLAEEGRMIMERGKSADAFL